MRALVAVYLGCASVSRCISRLWRPCSSKVAAPWSLVAPGGIVGDSGSFGVVNGVAFVRLILIHRYLGRAGLGGVGLAFSADAAVLCVGGNEEVAEVRWQRSAEGVVDDSLDVLAAGDDARCAACTWANFGDAVACASAVKGEALLAPLVAGFETADVLAAADVACQQLLLGGFCCGGLGSLSDGGGVGLGGASVGPS